MKEHQLSSFAAPGTNIETKMIPVTDQVSLQVIQFSPKDKSGNPAVLLVAGWITQIKAWEHVLRDLTRYFPVYYVETREKISSQVTGKVSYGVEDIGRDIVALVKHFQLTEKRYVLFGSSLGATAILDCCRFLKTDPLCLVLIGPNAVFRVPKLGLLVIHLMPPRLYLLIKPIVKWYLKHFRLDIESDYAQYEKYCNALDAADPWKLKKGALALSKYQVWDLLPEIDYPALIVGASKDTLHEPENLQRIVSMMKNATYLDLETNKQTHRKIMVEKMREYLQAIH